MGGQSLASRIPRSGPRHRALSLGPAPEEPTLELSDKLIHGLAYFSQTLAVLLAWIGRPGRFAQPLQVAVSTTLVIVVGGLFIELAQSLVSRETEALDALANTMGAGLGLALWSLLLRAGPNLSRFRNEPGDSQP
jgi:VanZ family protein